MVADFGHLSKARCLVLVEEAQRIVWEQEGRIIRLRAAGRDTKDAERILRLLETNPQTFQKYTLEYGIESRFSRSITIRICQKDWIQIRLDQLLDNRLSHAICHGGHTLHLQAPAQPVTRPSCSSASGPIDNSPGGIFLH